LHYWFYSPEDCDDLHSAEDGQTAAEEWLAGTIRGHQTENTMWSLINHGLKDVHGVQWAYLITSDSITMHNNAFQCFTSRSGRGIFMTWQRVAPTPVTFDFGASARRQLETTKFA